MTRNITLMPLAALAAAAAIGGSASAAYTITPQAGPAPTYSTVLNFDEVGGPTGSNVASGAWASIGITSFISGTGVNSVSNQNGTSPWLPNNNVYWAPFGAFINFSSDLSALSFQAWDTSGPPTFMGGGMAVRLYNDSVEVASSPVLTPAWGGTGNSWFNITTTDGSAFDEVRILGFGFSPNTYVDNMSWNAVPAPGVMAALGLAGLVSSSRRRRA